MLVTCDSNVIGVRTILVGQLDLDVMVVTDFIYGGSLLADDVGVVPGLDLENDRETTKSLHGERQKIQDILADVFIAQDWGLATGDHPYKEGNRVHDSLVT